MSDWVNHSQCQTGNGVHAVCSSSFSVHASTFSKSDSSFFFLLILKNASAGPDDRRVIGVELGRGYWNRVFESRSRHECFSLCFCVVLPCVGRGLCDGLITRPKESYRVSNTITQNARENHCIKTPLQLSSVSVVHKSCWKLILVLMTKYFIFMY
jgi:hypothetical protein